MTVNKGPVLSIIYALLSTSVIDFVTPTLVYDIRNRGNSMRILAKYTFTRFLFNRVTAFFSNVTFN